MPKYIIDLHPNKIEALNEKIVEILNMPEELLKQYTTRPYITEDEQATLEKAAIAYQSGKFMTAVKYYRKFSRRKRNVCESDDEKSQLDIVVQYLLSKSLMEMKEFSDLVEAKNLLLDLVETDAQKYPMIYCALAEFYMKLFCFEDAERTINKGLGILNGGNENLIDFYIPITHEIIVESTNQGLSRELLKLKEQCMGWHRPDAVCFMTDCRSYSPHHLAGRNIYFNSPAYNGLVVVSCNHVNACNIQFHAACWKEQKKILSSGQKMSDKDFLNWECFTPNCEYNLTTSRIQKIEFRDDDKVTKIIELPVEKQERPRNPPSKGATRKQKIKLINAKAAQAKKKSKPTIAREINSNQVKVLELPPNEIEELKPQPLKTNQLDENCQPNIQDLSIVRSTTNYHKKPVLDSQNNCEELAGMKSYLYSYFYQFICHNGPVEIDLVQKIWEEASYLIGNCNTFSYHSKCGNIIEFLRQSPLFAFIDIYVCINEPLPINHSSENSKVSTIQSEDADRQIIFDTDIKFRNAASVVNNSPCPATGTDAESTQHTEIISKNLKSLVAHNSDETFMDNEKLPYLTQRMERESIPPVHQENNDQIQRETKIVMNGDINNNDSHSSSPITISEESNELINSVIKELEVAKNELKVKDTQLIDMKMAMLRTNLDSQYMTISTFMNSRLIDCQKEYNIVSRMQNALLKYVGKPLPLDEREWIVPIESLTEMRQTLQETYDKKLAEINSKDHCKSIDDVHLTMPHMPPLLNRDVPEMLQIAFDLCFNHLQNSRTMPTVIVPNLYSPPLIPTPPLFAPPYGTYSTHLNHVQPRPPIIQPPHIHSQLPTSNNSQIHILPTLIPRQSTNNELKISSNNVDQHPKIDKPNPECDEVIIHEKIENRISTLNDEQGSNVAISEHQKPSLDLLLDLLRSRNKGVLEYDLLWCVTQVRKSNNNSLTGLPLSVIVDAVEQRLIQRKKLQLADYSVNLQKQTRPDPPNQRLRKVSASSTSLQVTTASSSRESVPRKNPWKINDDMSSRQDADFEQIDCAICQYSMKTYALNSVHKLQCNHAFHRKCIKKWFKTGGSCPICRREAEIDLQFPPL